MTAVLSASHVRKSFGNVQALKDASLTMQPGEVTALIGDNGAGKSTLVRCICGIHPPDAGTVEVQGKPVRFTNPEQARDAGIETVHQNLALVEDRPCGRTCSSRANRPAASGRSR